jgi:hypothetical protein
VIERAIFLHQNDDMLGIHEGAALFRINRGSPLNGRKQCAQEPGAAG